MRVHAASILCDFSKCACSCIPETCSLCQTYVDIALLMVHAANNPRDFSKCACSGTLDLFLSCCAEPWILLYKLCTVYLSISDHGSNYKSGAQFKQCKIFLSLVTLYSSMDHSPDKRYTFLKPLGQGIYGTAWLAEDTVTGRLLIFKEINKASSSVSDFKRELRYSKYL